ncbi:SAM-dependent methyltransferase [Terricaulis sp.]|uniref:SAM-dependent methyltransferase n=1 Tax=Terricaulis sp. TaxID=2768686 RepID=UPI002AC58E2A|nr:SAM-dependent methyltransferase [Terricaulis sp.]MDZ4690042.1 SAM-dependent methyltransferase [Terricaulis sp.]
MARGSLIVVGTGIRLAQQCTPEARDAIEAADVVFAVVPDPIAEHWLGTLNANIVSLQPLYGGDRTRTETYEAMTDAILDGVRAAKRVCAVFYGHPGVFVTPSHEAVRRARAEGFDAHLLPGISAEDCLYADLGVDPGRLGCQSYEATDFIVNARKIDTTAVLIIWQIAVAGELTLRVLAPDARRLAVLVKVLLEDYPPHHVVIVYEAATLPITEAKIQALPLRELHTATVSQLSTLYIPPLSRPQPSPRRLALLKDMRAAT